MFHGGDEVHVISEFMHFKIVFWLNCDLTPQLSSYTKHRITSTFNNSLIIITYSNKQIHAYIIILVFYFIFSKPSYKNIFF